MNDERRPRGSDPYLNTLLACPDPPSRDEYAAKKVLLAKKMDRLQAIGTAKMKFIKSLHVNNEKKRTCITCYNDRRLSDTCGEGLVKAQQIFEDVKQQHADMRSTERRMKVINSHCNHLEIQASQGLLGENDMEPLPTPGLFPNIDFEPFIPGYNDLIENAPSPFRVAEGELKDPLMAVGLLQPYRPPAPIQAKMKQRKARAIQQLQERRKQEEEERKLKKLAK